MCCHTAEGSVVVVLVVVAMMMMMTTRERERGNILTPTHTPQQRKIMTLMTDEEKKEWVDRWEKKTNNDKDRPSCHQPGSYPNLITSGYKWLKLPPQAGTALIGGDNVQQLSSGYLIFRPMIWINIGVESSTHNRQPPYGGGAGKVLYTPPMKSVLGRFFGGAHHSHSDDDEQTRSSAPNASLQSSNHLDLLVNGEVSDELFSIGSPKDQALLCCEKSETLPTAMAGSRALDIRYESLHTDLALFAPPKKRCVYYFYPLACYPSNDSLLKSPSFSFNVQLWCEVLWMFPASLEAFCTRFDNSLIYYCQIPRGRFFTYFSLFITGKQHHWSCYSQFVTL